MRKLAHATLALALSTSAFAARFPETAAYRGHAVDGDGKALSGIRAVEVRYYEGETKLLTERFPSVPFSDGKFALVLGAGAIDAGSESSSFEELAAHHPTLELAFRVDGADQSPRVRLLPAGHSAETRGILSAAVSATDSRIHAKGWRGSSGATAIQAAILRPGVPAQLPERPTPELQQGALELEVEGPSLSIPVRDMPTIDTSVAPETPVVVIAPPRFEPLLDENGDPVVFEPEWGLDPLASRSLASASLPSPPPIVSFEGIWNPNGLVPPDTDGAVGPGHYVHIVNTSFAVFDKTGGLVTGPVNTSSLWAGFSGGNCDVNNSGDGIVLYDRSADRWLIAQFQIAMQPWALCFAVSVTGNPTGAYYRYSLLTQRFPDYPKVGTWPEAAGNAWLVGTNSGMDFGYDVYALDRENMLFGLPARPAQLFQSFPNFMMPVDAGGATSPPPGSPGLFYSIRDHGHQYHGSPPADSLDLYECDVDWTTPANSTFALVKSFTSATDGFGDFNWTVCGPFVSGCLNQPGTTWGLDAIDAWPMKGLHYRRFAGHDSLADHESLVGSWTVDVTGTPNLAGIRWFELRRTGGAWSIYQQGTFSNGETGSTVPHRWMGSISIDGDGGIALGYSAMKDNGGAGDLYPSIRYAVRAEGDPLGTLRPEANLHTGIWPQDHHRWGDYSSMTVDPVDDCTFWYAGEYLGTAGVGPWVTRVGSFRNPGCGGLVIVPSSNAGCSTNPGPVTYDLTLLSQTFTGITDLFVADCPAGAACGFSDATLVHPQNTSELTISNLGSVTPGSYVVEVTATDDAQPSLTRTVAVELTVQAAAPAATALVSPANGAANVPVAATLTWTAVAGATVYEVELDDDFDFSSPLYAATVVGTSTPVPGLLPGAGYYWHVRAVNGCGGTYGPRWIFRTVYEYCSFPYLLIPDSPAAAVTDEIVIPPGLPALGDLDLFIFAGHQWIGDLQFRLMHDGGPLQSLYSRPGVPPAPGCGSFDLAITLDDEAANPVETACNGGDALVGTFAPNVPLGFFDGQSLSGTWTIEAEDDRTAFEGSLLEWCLRARFETLPFIDGFETGTSGAWSSTTP